jgi:hypothetical protein
MYFGNFWENIIDFEIQKDNKTNDKIFCIIVKSLSIKIVKMILFFWNRKILTYNNRIGEKLLNYSFNDIFYSKNLI